MRYRFLRFPEGKIKAVTFSYDDGVNQDVDLALILNKHGMKGTFNINTASLGAKTTYGYKLTAEEIRKHLLDTGHEIAIHGDNHIATAACRPIDAIKDVLNCRLALEETFGITVRGMAYPDSGIRKFDNGNDYQTVKQILTDLDVVYSRTAGGDNDSFRLPDDFHAWMPTAHHNNPSIFEFIERFNALKKEDLKGANCYPRLFYIWGHTYEFDRDGNWDRIKKICDVLEGKEDTWYATNMEIYEYVHAYRSLIISANGKRVYNPTVTKVWFNIDGKEYSVASGETVICE